MTEHDKESTPQENDLPPIHEEEDVPAYEQVRTEEPKHDPEEHGGAPKTDREPPASH